MCSYSNTAMHSEINNYVQAYQTYLPYANSTTNAISNNMVINIINGQKNIVSCGKNNINNGSELVKDWRYFLLIKSSCTVMECTLFTISLIIFNVEYWNQPIRC